MKRKVSIALIIFITVGIMSGCLWDKKETEPTASPSAEQETATPSADNVQTAVPVQETAKPGNGDSTANPSDSSGSNNGRDVKVGDNLTWPVDLLEGLPILKGNVISVISDDSVGAVTVTIKQVEEAEAVEYYEILKSILNKVMDINEQGEVLLFNGSKDDISVTYSYQYGGEKTATIIYNKKVE